MSQNKFLTMFQNQFDQLMDNLLKLTNNDIILRVNRNKIEGFIKLSGLKPVVLMFYKEFQQYKEHFVNNNMDFFLNLEIEQNEFKSLGNTLKNIYINSTDENKQALYKYVEILYKISEKVNSLN